jgi:CubicO group peptidase (beta-lactamase class C family)
VVSYGSAGPGARPLGELTVFEIGSITKVFTGTLLADMAARGEVSFGDPIADYLPDDVRVPSRGRPITLLDLSVQHSGLPRLPTNMTPADPTNPYADYTVEQMYAFLSAYELPREVGAEFEYSNLGVGLLGHLLSLAAGRGYEELVRARILEPLGMDMTAVTLDSTMRERMARGHDAQLDVVPLWDLPTLAGAGALRSNMRDMLTFLEANLGPPTSDLERAMRASHQVREDAGQDMGIGLNWLTRTTDGRRILWHNGGTGGFRTFLGFDPDAQVGVVVLTNSAHSADDIGFHLIDPRLPLTAAPVVRREIELPVETLERYIGVYELAPTFAIAVTVEDGALFMQATGQERIPAFAESETEFFLRIVDAQVTFLVDAAGNATGLILHQAGQNVPGRKVR